MAISTASSSTSSCATTRSTHTWWDGVRWALPINASRTFGASTAPALAAGPDGRLHAAWADTTPGYSTIYYGTFSAPFWANLPIPSGHGSSPTIGVTPQGEIYVAWQDRRSDSGKLDIFCAAYTEGVSGTPESVSDSAGANSMSPRLAISADGDCHLVWLEERDGIFQVYHADRRPNGWSACTAVSTGTDDCRLARIAANPAGYLHVTWVEGDAIAMRIRPAKVDAPWRPIERVTGDSFDTAALASAISRGRNTYLAWAERDDAGLDRLRHASRAPYPRFAILLPFVAG